MGAYHLLEISGGITTCLMVRDFSDRMEMTIPFIREFPVLVYLCFQDGGRQLPYDSRVK